MYNYITGIVTDKSKAKIVIENNKIGYDFSYVGDFSKVVIGSKLKVYVVGIFNNGIKNWCFLEKKTKLFFEELINIPGIGSVGAKNILNTYSDEELKNIIIFKDVNKLQLVPKIGKKTAHLIINKLEKKITNDDKDLVIIVKELMKLGYNRNLIIKQYHQLPTNLNVDEKIKLIIKNI